MTRGSLSWRERSIDVAAIPVGAVVLVTAMILLLGLRQSFTVPGALGLSPASLILFCAGGLWALTRVLGQRDRAHLGLLSASVIGYGCVSLLSFGSLASRPTDPELLAGSQTNMLTELALISVFFFVVTVVRTRSALEWVSKGLVLGGAISSLFAIAQYATGIDFASMFKPPLLKDHGSVLSSALMREGFARPQGSAGHPLELSAVLTVLVPIGMGVVYSARAKGDRSWPWILATVSLVASAALTLSRSAIVGLAVAALVMAWKWPVRRVVSLAVIVAIPLIVAYVTNSKLLKAFVQVFATSATDSSLQSRDAGREFVLQHFSEHWWLGQGPATYTASGYPVLDNQYLGRLMESGVVGLLTFILLLGVSFGCAVFAARRFFVRAQNHWAPTVDSRADRATFELVTGIAASIAAYAVVSLILDVSGFTQIWVVLWILAALAGSAVIVSRPSGSAQNILVDAAPRVSAHAPRVGQSS